MTAARAAIRAATIATLAGALGLAAGCATPTPAAGGGSTPAQASAPARDGAAAEANTPPPVRAEDHLAAGGLAPAGVLTNPHAGDAAVAAAGPQLYSNMNCDGCHAPDASGAMGPSLIDGRWRYGGSATELFTSIYYGRPKGMPAFGGVLGTEGVWTLVTWLQSVKPPAGNATESWEE